MSIDIKKTFSVLIILFIVNFLIINAGISKQTESLTIIKSHGKYGYKNKSGKVIVKPIYDKVQVTPEGLIVVIKNNKLGLINKDGKVLVPPKYVANLLEYRLEFYDGLAAVVKKDKNGLNNCVYIDKTGKEVLDPTKYGYSTVQDETYGSCSRFSEGLAPATHNWKPDSYGGYTFDCGYTFDYGYINKQGKLVINLKNINIDDQMCGDALCIGSFEKGVASVAVDGKWKYINRAGIFISEKTALKKKSRNNYEY